ncbi:hypothetical protein TWF730_002473 [Orbilia blumenaviensis]|uniref:Uncharacterized protein n=1 Tax=Orbilia blumenaviensis TaxID=1796055 RepID=A0AAV9UD18_9PEZI
MMHVPSPHDYDTTGDVGANETHHTLHSSGAALTGPNKILFLLTLIVGVWMISQMITPVHAGVIKRQDDDTESTSTQTETVTEVEGEGQFTYYQLNGDGSTETPVVQQDPEETKTEEGDDGVYTTVFPSTHDGTTHNHVSVVTEPETTDYVTDVVVQTDVVTITLSDLDPSEDGFRTSVVTHTGTWTHKHLPNEEPHTASWTHHHTVTGPPESEGTGGESSGDGDGNDNGDGDGDGDGNGDGGEENEGSENGGSDHTHPTCSFDFENHTSDIDEQIHHSTHMPGENTLTWAHDITLTYETTKTLIFGGTTYDDVITSTITEEEIIIVTTETKTLIDDGVTYTDVDVITSTKFGEIEVTTLTHEIVDGGTTYEEIATVTTTDFHFDPVTTIDEEEWTAHTKTHPHKGGPTEYLPEHTHHHTFTLYETVTSTITTLDPSATDIYTEWVKATTITL